ncbi:hypothetical protein [Streptomyces sp. NPDC047108]|uniref:hypothetical protein n=1 Tax=Streptomyces sp. NPDC047108 TaxID=3155025 RepID=UPI0033DB3D67
MITGEGMQLPGWRGGDANAAYLDKTLRHRDIELGLAESVGWRVVLQLWLRAFVVSAAVFVIPGFIGLMTLIADAGSSYESAYGYGDSGDDGGGAGWLVFAFIASGVSFWLVLLLTRVTEPIAAWRVLLADREDRAVAVYSQIRGTLRARRSPLVVRERRMRAIGPGAGVANRLVLSDGPYNAYVSVFSYGTSLYLGWMMWRSRRGATLIAQFVGDLFRGILGQNSPEEEVMRADRPQAMREAVHLACREGLFVAIEGIDVPDSYGFPQGLPPVEEAVMPAAPAPGMGPGQGQAPGPVPGAGPGLGGVPPQGPVPPSATVPPQGSGSGAPSAPPSYPAPPPQDPTAGAGYDTRAWRPAAEPGGGADGGAGGGGDGGAGTGGSRGGPDPQSPKA